MSYYRYTNSSYYKPSFFGGFRFFPPVIKSLLISNVAIYVLMSFFGLFSIHGFPLSFLINTIFPLYPLGNGFHVWQLLTYMFMHGGLMHLFFNMFALWMFGMELENQWGSKKFFLYYIMCGLGAGLSNLLIAPLFSTSGPTVGASGAVYGILIAFGMLYPDRPIFVYFLLPIRAKYFVMFYIGLEIYAGITGTTDGIAHFAHLGGAAVGFFYIIAEEKKFTISNFLRKKKMHYVPGNVDYDYTFSDSQFDDANFLEHHDKTKNDIEQRIDEILDKINQYGYQSLTDEEKKILFEASKKLN